MHVGISEILRQRNDLVGATRHLQQARELGDENGLPQNPYRSRVAAAGLRWAHGDVSGALDLLGEADRLYFSDFAPDVRPVDAVRARVWLSEADYRTHSAGARARLSAADDLTYVREFEYATLARVLLAQGSLMAPRIHSRGDRIDGSTPDRGGCWRPERQRGHPDRAGARPSCRRRSDGASRRWLAPSDRRAGGLRPPVHDEGPSMVALLKLAAKDRNAPGYVRQLLAASTVARPGEGVVAQPLIEPLSERELEVLRLLQSDLDGPSIARELTVSLPTVRTHTSNIYSKLGAGERRAAVRRAGELACSPTTDRA
jgi:LuxR family maltose regulon positive regulatory protein